MANYCDFIMLVTGRKESIGEIYDMMSWHGRFANSGLGRIYDIQPIDDMNEGSPSDIISIEFTGGCAWSVESAMKEGNGSNYSLESESKRLNLVIEVFSEEIGIGFQEHVLINKGEVLIDECVDYHEHYIGFPSALQTYNEECGTDFTENMMDDEYVREGGFENYGEYRDHMPYMTQTNDLLLLI